MKKIQLKTGMWARGAIDGTSFEGQLLIYEDKSRAFILQGVKSGANPNLYKLSPEDKELLAKHTYSWAFHIGHSTPLTDGVVITHLSTTEETLNEGKLFKDIETVEDRSFIEVTGQGAYFTGKEGNRTKLFSRTTHPDCCGCTILYSFCGSEKTDYSRYKDLTDEHIEDLKVLLWSEDPASKLAHIASPQIAAHEFMNRVGFKAVHTYINAKTTNLITVYQLDRIQEKDVNTEFLAQVDIVRAKIKKIDDKQVKFTFSEESRDNLYSFDSIIDSLSSETPGATNADPPRSHRAHRETPTPAPPRGVIPPRYEHAMSKLRGSIHKW